MHKTLASKLTHKTLNKLRKKIDGLDYDVSQTPTLTTILMDESNAACYVRHSTDYNQVLDNVDNP